MSGADAAGAASGSGTNAADFVSLPPGLKTVDFQILTVLGSQALSVRRPNSVVEHRNELTRH
jgi:hypothetical protein